MSDLTATALRAAVHYDPLTGAFTRKTSLTRTDLLGKPAGTILKSGYVSVHIGGRHYLAHRLAHVYMTGQWPAEHMDHKNGARSDNRWENLRPATRAQNNQNARAKSAAGLKGVEIASDHRRLKRYLARICANGKRVCLGYFSTPEEAHAAYCAAAARLHGEFARFE